MTRSCKMKKENKMNEISLEEIKALQRFANQDIRFGVAFNGALSQIRIRDHLINEGYKVVENQSDNAGDPDFVINGKTMEHKRARNKTRPNGTILVEFQKSRGKQPERLYKSDFSEFVSVDVSSHTGIKNDFRYNLASNLKRSAKYTNRIAPLQEVDRSWCSSLSELLHPHDPEL